MGYRPQQWIDKVTKRRLEVYSDDIQRHAASILAPDPLRLPSQGATAAAVTELPAKQPVKAKKEVA